jgi:DNA (cytosine-5)-methyltransferase 1
VGEVLVSQLELFLPDRYEQLKKNPEDDLKRIISPVESALEKIDELHSDMVMAGRGSFAILYGTSGTGKTTFLNTIKFFRRSVETESIQPESSIREDLKKYEPHPHELRIITIDSREALKDIPSSSFEADLHAINIFLRSDAGQRTLVVWPCNTESLRDRLEEIARKIGGDALLGIDEKAIEFSGPEPSQYVDIASKTIETLNDGASITDLGLSTEEAEVMASQHSSVGRLLGTLRREIAKRQTVAKRELKKIEQFKLWTIVVAGNEPSGEVAALSRGTSSALDIQRMMSATQANIVAELRRHPETAGLLANTLDSKVFYLPVLAALEIVRAFPPQRLEDKMREAGLSRASANKAKALDRIKRSEIGQIFENGRHGIAAKGRATGSNTLEAFSKLLTITQTDDSAVDAAIGEALKAGGYIDSYDCEVEFGSSQRIRSDIYCSRGNERIRIEVMWRKSTGRADIANYLLLKLTSYGKSLGIFK